MDFLHYQLTLSSSDIVRIELDRQANVRLFDDINFSRFRRGQRCNYHGGLAAQSPVMLSAPRAGHWHLTIDLGGARGTVRASVSTLTG